MLALNNIKTSILGDFPHMGCPPPTGENEHRVRSALAQHLGVPDWPGSPSVFGPVSGKFEIVDSIPPRPVSCDPVRAPSITLDDAINHRLASDAVKRFVDPIGVREVTPAANKKPHRKYSTLLFLIALSGCAGNPPPIDNAFCVLYQRLPDPADAVHMKKRENKLAILANEQTANECTGSSGLVNGPR